MSDSSRPHGLQPTRLLRPWNFPGKSTGVGCHCLLTSKRFLLILELRRGIQDASCVGPGKSQWHPTPVLLPGKSHGQRSLVGCRPWGREESDTTERLHFYFSLSLFTLMHWRRKWQPTPVFLPGESQEWGSLVGCRLWGRTESDTTEAT